MAVTFRKVQGVTAHSLWYGPATFDPLARCRRDLGAHRSGFMNAFPDGETRVHFTGNARLSECR